MLNVITVDEALKIIKEKFSAGKIKTEILPIDEALGALAAQAVYSVGPVPGFARSTMDGYALTAEDTYGAGESLPAWLKVIGEINMGESAEKPVKRGECFRISTGGMLPPGANAVIPVENTEEDNGMCLVYKAVSVFENVTKAGDDIKPGERIVNDSEYISPAVIGLLASAGIGQVTVRKKPVVGIISTGNEIAGLDEPLPPGKIREVNSHIISAFCRENGCDAIMYGTVKDEYDVIYTAVKKAAEECDTLVISGGSSAGTKDMTVKIIEDMGSVFVHGLAMKPGKPTIIGEIGGKPVLGLPGHPAACFFVTEIIIKPLVGIMTGRTVEENTMVCELGENISSNHGREEYLCVKTEGNIALPVYAKSGVMSVICRSDGYIKIDRNCEGLKKGEKVKVFLFRR
ncbi:MAG: molybdopterin molybdenumtransferase MoeA [Clostridiales bacterium]|nr:molybdopterin molybdenumtransferase MoeA [Clostridiales bacterium]